MGFGGLSFTAPVNSLRHEWPQIHQLLSHLAINDRVAATDEQGISNNVVVAWELCEPEETGYRFLY